MAGTTNMFVLRKIQDVIAMNTEDINDITNEDIPSFLCILISDQRKINERIDINITVIHIERVNLIITLSII